jgi:hypothetical protein
MSFNGVDLHSMHGLLDNFGADHVAWATRAGTLVSKYVGVKPSDRSLLYQEVQAIALKSKRLRRINFGNCLPRRRPKDNFDTEGNQMEKDPGCEIVAALFPLCRGRFTNITWITLSGIELGETDMDDMSKSDRLSS